MIPRRPWILLLAIAVLAIAVDRALARRDGARTDHAAQVLRLLPPERTSGHTVAAISIALGSQEENRLTYLRSKGAWRSREAFGAIADEAAIQTFMRSCFEAQGTPRTEDPARAEAYGLGPEQRIEVTFHGPKLLDAPDRDLLFGFDLGRRFDDGAFGRSFARALGATAILELDHDLARSFSAGTGPELPPWIDTRLCAGLMPEGFAGFREFRVEAQGAEKLTLTMKPPADPSAEPVWTLEQAGRATPCLEWRAGGYTAFWIRGRYEGVASPKRAPELGLDPPAARITLTPSTGAPFTIEIGALRPSGEAWAWNRATNVLMRIARETRAAAIPDAALFLDATRPNPWETWLRQK
jgi:hypothetical protein